MIHHFFLSQYTYRLSTLTRPSGELAKNIQRGEVFIFIFTNLTCFFPYKRFEIYQYKFFFHDDRCYHDDGTSVYSARQQPAKMQIYGKHETIVNVWGLIFRRLEIAVVIAAVVEKTPRTC